MKLIGVSFGIAERLAGACNKASAFKNWRDKSHTHNVKRKETKERINKNKKK
jgi:hypothetical protein